MKSLAIKLVAAAVLCASLSGCLIITETHSGPDTSSSEWSAASSESVSGKSF